MVHTVLLVIAIVLFILQGIGVKTGNVSPGWFGLAFFAGAFLL